MPILSIAGPLFRVADWPSLTRFTVVNIFINEQSAHLHTHQFGQNPLNEISAMLNTTSPFSTG